MRWLVFGTCLTAFAGAWAAGLALGRHGKRAATGAILVGLALVLLRVGLHGRPDVEHALLGDGGYALVRPWWVFPFALLLLAAGAPHLSSPRAGRGLHAAAALLFLLAGHRLWVTARFDPAGLGHEVDEHGVVLQTTDYTCGAAAAATLLRGAGVQATEAEMADACFTNALTGTDVFGVCRGLRRRLEGTGRAVRVLRSDWDGLAAHTPALATLRLATLLDHWVVVLERGADDVLVADPLRGRVRLPRPEFEERWGGLLVGIAPVASST